MDLNIVCEKIEKITHPPKSSPFRRDYRRVSTGHENQISNKRQKDQITFHSILRDCDPKSYRIVRAYYISITIILDGIPLFYFNFQFKVAADWLSSRKITPSTPSRAMITAALNGDSLMSNGTSQCRQHCLFVKIRWVRWDRNRNEFGSCNGILARMEE